MSWRRIIDALVVAVVVLTGAESLREVPAILRGGGQSPWQSVVGIGQLLAGAGAIVTLVGLWRRPAWLRRGAVMWGIGGMIAGPVATFAWDDVFNRDAFLGAVGATALLAVLVYRWSVSRTRTVVPVVTPPPSATSA